MRSIRISASALLLAGVAVMSGCASHRLQSVATVTPPPVAITATAPPAGSYPGMPIPARLADGSYATPNRALSAAATVWHFRAGLNVAALACRGPGDALVAARYNAILTRQSSVLRDSEARLADEYRSGGGTAWRARYDHAMTVLYNFFSQGFAHDTFCASATQILAESETIAPAAFPAFAAARLPVLDGAFTDFYARYDRWRAGAAPAAITAPAPPPIVAQRRAAPRATMASTPATPWIQLDQVALLPDPEGREVHGGAPRTLAATRPRR